MAEGLFTVLVRCLDDHGFISVSAGVDTAPVHPLAIEVMKEAGIDIATQHSKDTTEASRERFAFLISV